MAKKRKNIRRTCFLAVFAAATFVYSAIFHFDIEPQVMLGYFYDSLLMVGFAIVCAILGVVILRFIRR